MDLTAVEGLADLIDAETEAQRRQAVSQSAGHLGALYEDWRYRLIRALALTESALDFADEGDVTAEVLGEARAEVAALKAALAAHLADRHRGEILRDGFRVVIAGPPNVGKSSLLNALARRDAAIVSEEAGTTRDVIEVHLDLDGFPVIVTDTAGIRGAAAAVEQEGIRRTLKRASDADLLIWLMAPENRAADLPESLQGLEDRVLRVVNKIDLLPSGEPQSAAYPGISCRTGAGLEGLTGTLAEEARMRIGVLAEPAISRPRHRRELERCVASLEAFLAGGVDELELRAEELRQAAHALGHLTGRIDVEDVLDEIFAAFCIGK
jgi:tRNA modification GTPase